MISEVLTPSLRTDQNIDSLVRSFDYGFMKLKDQVIHALIYPRIDALRGELLDLLGWQFHIEGFELSKTEEEKRSLIKRAIEIHSLKGTLAGIKFATELAGGKILKTLLPWDRIYLSKSLTPEERKAFYELYPELRITSIAYRGKTHYRHAKLYTKAYKPYTSDADTRYGIRAYIYRNGKLTALKTQEKTQIKEERQAIKVVQIAQKGTAQGHFGRVKDRFLVDHQARKRFYTLQVPERYTHTEVRTQTKVVYPSESPLSVYYQLVHEKGKHQKSQAFIYFLQGHTCPTDAYRRIYKRTHLYDENVALQLRRAVAFLNSSPIRVPAYHALTRVELRNRSVIKSRFPGRQSKKKLMDVCRMIAAFKSVRDKILIDTKTREQILADGRITAGQAINAGGMVNV